MLNKFQNQGFSQQFWIFDALAFGAQRQPVPHIPKVMPRHKDLLKNATGVPGIARGFWREEAWPIAFWPIYPPVPLLHVPSAECWKPPSVKWDKNNNKNSVPIATLELQKVKRITLLIHKALFTSNHPF